MSKRIVQEIIEDGKAGSEASDVAATSTDDVKSRTSRRALHAARQAQSQPLPPEIWTLVLQALPVRMHSQGTTVRTILAVGLTSKALRKIALAPAIWVRLLKGCWERGQKTEELRQTAYESFRRRALREEELREILLDIAQSTHGSLDSFDDILQPLLSKQRVSFQGTGQLYYSLLDKTATAESLEYLARSILRMESEDFPTDWAFRAAALVTPRALAQRQAIEIWLEGAHPNPLDILANDYDYERGLDALEESVSAFHSGPLHLQVCDSLVTFRAALDHVLHVSKRSFESLSLSHLTPDERLLEAVKLVRGLVGDICHLSEEMTECDFFPADLAEDWQSGWGPTAVSTTFFVLAFTFVSRRLPIDLRFRCLPVPGRTCVVAITSDDHAPTLYSVDVSTKDLVVKPCSEMDALTVAGPGCSRTSCWVAAIESELRTILRHTFVADYPFTHLDCDDLRFPGAEVARAATTLALTGTSTPESIVDLFDLPLTSHPAYMRALHPLLVTAVQHDQTGSQVGRSVREEVQEGSRRVRLIDQNSPTPTLREELPRPVYRVGHLLAFDGDTDEPAVVLSWQRIDGEVYYDIGVLVLSSAPTFFNMAFSSEEEMTAHKPLESVLGPDEVLDFLERMPLEWGLLLGGYTCQEAQRDQDGRLVGVKGVKMLLTERTKALFPED